MDEQVEQPEPQPVLRPEEQAVMALCEQVQYFATGLGVQIEVKINTAISTPSHIGTVAEGARGIIGVTSQILKELGILPQTLLAQPKPPKPGIILPND